MSRVFSSFFLIVALFLGGCAKEGTVYDAPIDTVYTRLSELDLGRGHESAVFRYNEDSPPTDTQPNQSVSWFMGKNGKGTEVIAHLSDEGGGKTRVFVDVKTPDMGQMAMFKGFASNMIRERVASYLEERPYNDQKFIDAMYGGNASLVPAEIRQAGADALKMEADMIREREAEDAEADTRGPTSSVSQSAVMSGKPMVDLDKR